MVKQVISWIFTVPFILAFGLLLLIFDPLQRLARLLGPRPHEIVAGILQACLLWAFRLCGTRVVVERSPLVKSGAPYIFIANHQSLFDIAVLGGLLFKHYPKYVSKKELAKWYPSISYNLRRGGHAIIDREDRDQALREIRSFGERISKRNVSAVIYPEGTRARSGEIRYFIKTGVTELLEAAPNIPVVPVALDGSWKLLENNLWPVPFGTRVNVHIGAPIPRTKDEDPTELVRRVQNEIKASLQGWRKLEEGS